MTATSYMRVIPRDLFNESKLLKCLGQLALFAHDGIDGNRRAFPKSLSLSHDGDAFDIQQDPSDGGLQCENLVLRTSDGERLRVYSIYNSKSPYPLCCEHDELGEVPVLDDSGNLDAEFLEAFAS